MSDINIQNIQDRLANNWQRVLFRLWVAKLRNEYFFLVPGETSSIIRGGWLPVWAVTESMIGGSSGDRRLRQLRDKGFPFKQSNINGHIENYKIHEWHLYGKKIRTFIYCLDCDLTPDDWEEILDKNAKYHYRSVQISKVVPKKEIHISQNKAGQICFA